MPTIRKLLFFVALAVVVVRPSIAADSLVVSPPNPTIMDSIRLSILAIDWRCCTQFSYDSTAVILVNDSTITLSFTAVSPPVVCWCPSNPVTQVLSYKRGPLSARNYSVYEQYQSCTGQICSDVVVQSFIGKFTVSKPTATVFHQKSVPLENIGMTSGTRRVYNIRGALVSPNRLGASRQTPGVYFIKPDERSTAKLKLWY